MTFLNPLAKLLTIPFGMLSWKTGLKQCRQQHQKKKISTAFKPIDHYVVLLFVY